MEDIRQIKISDPSYPAGLKKLKNPPKIIFYRGNPNFKKNAVAIVGSRKYTPYGKQIALEIAGDLAQSGIAVISGMASGIDTFAHQACLEKNGYTIAVLGSGIDDKSIFPSENVKLAREIIESGGCVLSEYPPGTKGAKYTFPNRNRIIAALSQGITVIEAPEKSGSLITAQWGKILKKKIFAIPNSIYCASSKGCNALIKNGAMLAEDAQDIIQGLGIKQTDKTRARMSGDDNNETAILKILCNGPAHIDKIIESSGLAPSQICSSLAILEIKGKVRNLGGNMFCLAK